MTKNQYQGMIIKSEFVEDNIDLLKALLKHENDSMTYNHSNYTRAKFAIDNSIELLNQIKCELEAGIE